MKSAILLETGDIQNSRKVVSGKLFGTAATLRALVSMLPKPCGCPDAAGKEIGRSNRKWILSTQ
jgi:hypothetical protein